MERRPDDFDAQPAVGTMRRLGIHEALAFDADFVTAGFTLLGDD